MQPYDMVMLAILVVTTILGAIKGMAWQLASILSLGLSYVAAIKFCDQVAPHIGAEPPLNRYLAMLLLYIGTSLAIWMFFRVIAGMIDRVQLQGFDRQLGAMFGAAKGILVCIAITFFAVTLSTKARDMVLKSRSGYYIATLIDRANPVLPDGVHELLDPYLRRLDQELDPQYTPPRTAAGEPDVIPDVIESEFQSRYLRPIIDTR